MQLGRESYTPEHRFLSEDESFEVAVQFRREHPWRLPLISTILGWGDLRDDNTAREFTRTHPLVTHPTGRRPTDLSGSANGGYPTSASRLERAPLRATRGR